MHRPDASEPAFCQDTCSQCSSKNNVIKELQSRIKSNRKQPNLDFEELENNLREAQKIIAERDETIQSLTVALGKAAEYRTQSKLDFQKIQNKLGESQGIIAERDETIHSLTGVLEEAAKHKDKYEELQRGIEATTSFKGPKPR